MKWKYNKSLWTTLEGYESICIIGAISKIAMQDSSIAKTPETLSARTCVSGMARTSKRSQGIADRGLLPTDLIFG